MNKKVLDTIKEFVEYLGTVHAWLKQKIDVEAQAVDFPEPPPRDITINILELLHLFHESKFKPDQVDKVEQIIKILAEQNEAFIDLAVMLLNSPFDHQLGIANDVEDFIFEKDAENSDDTFWKSFWHTCASMLYNDVDLSDKQLKIIHREYDKVKHERQAGFLAAFLNDKIKKAGE